MRSVVIIPVLGNPEQTYEAIQSAKAQTGIGKVYVLVVDQGGVPNLSSWNHETDRFCCRVWRHQPSLPSLAAVWNCALDYAWASGAEDALVINNDVELVPEYYQWLRSALQLRALWFLSGVGVTPKQFKDFSNRDAGSDYWMYDVADQPFELHPDFSAFLITQQCHRLYRFDESYIPAYCEDQDYHRRLLLDGHGRKIGKINLPFLHHASGTLKAMTPEENERKSIAIHVGSRAYHEKKWAGPVNQERAVTPFGPAMPFDVSMDRLRQWTQDGKSVEQELYRCSIKAAEELDGEAVRPESGPDPRPGDQALPL